MGSKSDNSLFVLPTSQRLDRNKLLFCIYLFDHIGSNVNFFYCKRKVNVYFNIISLIFSSILI